METENYPSEDIDVSYVDEMSSIHDSSIYATFTDGHVVNQNGGHSRHTRNDNQRYENGLTKGFNSSASINEEELLNCSKDSLRRTSDIENEINTLLKQKYESESEILKETNQNIKYDTRSIYEELVREIKMLGQNFVLVWLGKTDNPKNFYERAKNNLSFKLKYDAKQITEKDFMDELITQFEKELAIK
jgi:hypothetical protein